MARYRVNDAVIFSYIHIKNANGIITKVIKDVEKGDAVNIYQVTVINHPRYQGLQYSIRDKNIQHVVPLPAENDLNNLKEEEIGFDPHANKPAEEKVQVQYNGPGLNLDDDWINMWKDVAEIKPINPVNKKVKYRLPDYFGAPEPRPLKEIEIIDVNDLAEKAVLDKVDEVNEVGGVPIAPDPKDYVIAGNHLPEYFININNRFIPVYLYDQDLKHKANLTEDHYRMNFKETGVLYIFQLANGRKMAPRYINRGNKLYYIDAVTGTVYVNQYQRKSVWYTEDHLKDINSQRWNTEENVMLHEMRHGEVPPVGSIIKSRKKLRKKYKEMPKIKEEKYYATKDYIA